VLQQVREGYDYVGVTPYGDDDLLHVRAVVADWGDTPFLVQALYPLTQRVSELSDTVQAAFTRYRELAFLRQSLKFSFSLTLLLVMLFSFFSAVWAALFSARRLVAPVSELAMATRAVAEGDYSTQLPPPRVRDELGFLVSSFNAMTRRIAQARDAAAESQRLVESQRAYLESVLSHLSTGVMAFDFEGKLRTANAAAGQILGLDPAVYEGCAIRELAVAREALVPLVEAVTEEWARPSRDWEIQVTIVDEAGRKVLRCGGSPLPLGEDGAGWLIMIEDITMLIQAQRDSAWGEVARRLAHEIKNPLTPIQLSAERIRRRYLGRFTDEEGGVLDRATHTIVQQVEAMKSMVNAFSDYARPSKLEPEPLVFDRLVAEVLELYRAAGGFALDIQLAAKGAMIKADSVKLRQVIHNLVKNAKEALSEREGGIVRVSTRQLADDETCVVELVVEDNGPGFDRDLIGRVFDPYVTTKAKGTGLGLAIVRKIVEEHGGSIAVGHGDLGGGKVTVRLPECDAVVHRGRRAEIEA
jgi:nitrogen fixation/metabolism regulation signal transduction histidine kinase